MTTASDADIRTFRAWVRFLIRREQRTLLQRLSLKLGNPWSLVRFVVLGFRALVRHGRPVVNHHGVPMLAQATRMTSAYFSYGVNPSDFYLYQFFLAERHASIGRHFTFYSHAIPVQAYLYWYCPDRQLLQDKIAFAKRCREIGLPTIPVLAEFVDGKATWRDATTLPSENLFSKRAIAFGGYGARAWHYEEADRFVDVGSGRSFDQASLVEELARQSAAGQGPVILQRAARNHGALAPLTSGALATLRLVTCRTPSGDLDVLPPFIRIPAGRSAVDNFSQGGLVAPVDLATGRICGAALRKGDRLGNVKTDRHPDTGVGLSGFELPLWTETVALAKRAHALFPSLPFVGWDIAILQDGPVVVEGNVLWDHDPNVLTHGLSLSDTPFIPYCIFHIDLHPEGIKIDV